MWRFTPFFMWGGDNSNFLNGRMFIEDTSYLNRRNILPATNDDIFFTVNNIDSSAFIDRPHVAGVQPAVNDRPVRFFFIFPVAFHDTIAFDDDFSNFGPV